VLTGSVFCKDGSSCLKAVATRLGASTISCTQNQLALSLGAALPKFNPEILQNQSTQQHNFHFKQVSHHQAPVHNSSAKQQASNQHEADDAPSPKPALLPRTACCCLLHCTWARISEACFPGLQPHCWRMYTSWHVGTKMAVQELDIDPHNSLDMCFLYK
jgi:hypothetical protein